jgi:uncharacterized protein (TIGR02001 family)
VRNVTFLVATAALAMPAVGSAQEHTFTGNVTVASDYRFRGISQTFAEGGEMGPALQGGFDYLHESGWYLGNWNSNVSGNQYPNGASIEMDFYGGWKQSFDDFGVDVGTIYYHYPGVRFSGLTSASGGTTRERVTNWELYAGASWRWLSVKYYYALTNYFGTSEDVAITLDSPDDASGPLARNGDTRGTQYLTASVAVPVLEKLTAKAGVGVTYVENYDDLDYVDYSVGLTYDLNGWLLGASFVGTNADDNHYFASSGAGRVKEIGKPSYVLTLGRTF